MSKVIVTADLCKQCGYCERHCPKEAISFSSDFNANGFKYAVVDDDKCIACGMCYTTCPDGVFEITQ
ncbi:MAG: 4Fe-4S binding protein [Clostridiales Family XIII bacterium]|nr:4Fe-4S binding protein [Clostridiales Family XIII bacterium]